jgi:hypothetical protein
MKIFNIILKVVFGLLLLNPILGVTGIFPAPTADLYNTPQAYEFIRMLYDGGYVVYIMGIVAVISLYALITKRTAFAAFMMFPITLNIICFHAFLDGGLFTMGALMADVLFLINLYFVWQNRGAYKQLFDVRG